MNGMNFRFGKPDTRLSPFIKHYWAIENYSYRRENHTQRIIPCGLPELTFYFNSIPKSLDPDKTLQARSLITGQQRQFYDLQLSGTMNLFSIVFHAHGLTNFFNIPSSQFYNQIIPLQYIIKHQAEQLESSLFAQTNFEDKIAVAESFLMKLLFKSQPSYAKDRIRHCVEIINRQSHFINVGTLASEACLSLKQFERTFSDHIGSSPKQFLKIIRFQNTLHKKSAQIKNTLTELAYDCGYFDLSHMSNDFKKLSGMSPHDYFTKCDAFSDYFHQA